MPPSLFRTACLLFLTLVALPAGATGLGELTVHSGIGEPLRASIDIAAPADGKTDSHCFSLQPIPDSDLPVARNVRLHLERRQSRLILHLTGRQPVHDPLLVLRLRAACGADLQRDYVILPQAPAMEAARPARSARTEIMPPSPPARAERSISAAPTRTEKRPARQTAQAATASAPAENRLNTAPPARPAAREAPSAPRSDRLILDTSLLDEFQLPPSVRAESEARLLRLETSLDRLNQTLASLDQALAARRETRAHAGELQLAHALSLPPVADRETLALTGAAWLRWMELLFGALLGGIVAAGAIHWLEGRRQTGLSRSTN